MKISEEMSELIGAIIGDGNIYKNRYVEISGDRILDLDYFKQRLSPIIRKELSYTPFIRTGPFGVRLRINNKNFTFFLNKLGIQSGKGKTYNVRIPTVISKSRKRSKACIRGIIDTDGCLAFDKRRVYRTPYPRILLHIRNRGLSIQLYQIFLAKGFKPTFSIHNTRFGEAYTVYLNGRVQVLKYIKEIGFSNNRHLKVNGSLLYNHASVAQSG